VVFRRFAGLMSRKPSAAIDSACGCEGLFSSIGECIFEFYLRHATGRKLCRLKPPGRKGAPEMKVAGMSNNA
jgi:hypothetical protein